MRKSLHHTFIFACVSGVYLMPEMAYAVSLDSSIGASICQLVGMMAGAVGKAMATLAVMFIGIASFFGKAKWDLVITTTLGIAVIFSAADIAESIGITGAGSACAGSSGSSLLGQKLSTGLCQIVAALQGTTGAALSSLGVIFVGLASFFGKANWQLVITTTMGIAMLQGGAAIVGALFNQSLGGDCLPSIGLFGLLKG